MAATNHYEPPRLVTMAVTNHYDSLQLVAMAVTNHYELLQLDAVLVAMEMKKGEAQRSQLSANELMHCAYALKMLDVLKRLWAICWSVYLTVCLTVCLTVSAHLSV